MKAGAICCALGAALMMGWLVFAGSRAAMADDADAPAAKRTRGRYENPEKIRRRDQNPEIRGEQDLWKLKYLSWDYKSKSVAAEKIFTALDEPTQLEFIDTPLGDAIDFLSSLHNIQIVLDQRALLVQGIGTDTPVTRVFQEITLASALQMLLGDLDLDYLVANEVLLITTRKEAAARLETHVYETRLLKTVPSRRLAEVVVETVAPQSWYDEGGAGRIQSLPGCLIIHQTQRVHAEVVDLLQQLEAHEGNPIFGTWQPPGTDDKK